MHLWPLPSAEAEDDIQQYKSMVAAPPTSFSDWDRRPQWERSREEDMCKIQEKALRERIAERGELEVALWTRWCARFLLISFAIAGWVLFAMNKLRWKIILPTTTVLLIVGYVIFTGAVYSEFFRLWSSGRIVFGYAPWQLTIFPLVDYIVIPLLLVGLTIAAFFGRATQSGIDRPGSAI